MLCRLLVNVEGTINLLLECAARCTEAPIRFVYASSVAACLSANQTVDGPLDSPVRLIASTSYGTHKGIGVYTTPTPLNGSQACSKICMGVALPAGEMLVSDLSRRGEVDGLTVRLPTVTVRAGVPSGAASSFVSDIIREVLSRTSSERYKHCTHSKMNAWIN